MRFPLSLTWSMTRYLAKQRLLRRKHFPLVLMLEPLHACNLRCTGCGRIREYADSLDQRLSVDECLKAVEDCGAPIVSICGGEPLIHPDIQEIVEKILERGKPIYLCTNGQLLVERLDRFKPSSRFYINVHLDGGPETHDAITGKVGSYQKAIEGIEAAKKAGFLVYTNTTVYNQTTVDDLERFMVDLTALDIDGFMLSPGYGYAAVKDESSQDADEIFMTRERIKDVFREISERLSTFRLVTSPLYMEFLRGERKLDCAAWANPTYNTQGWKGPCYLMTDRPYETYRELIDQTDWDSLGFKEDCEVGEPQGDPRCRHCMVHCGYEPAAVLFAKGIKDLARMAIWQLT